MTADLSSFLAPNRFVDSDHPAVIAYARAHSVPGAEPIDNAVALYLAVRDGFRYSPWQVHTTPEAYQASAVLARERPEGHCIDKAVLLAAASRVLQIPSRLHFAIVRNHIGTEELEQQLGTDLLVFHGYVELHLQGQWVSATPAFNAALCAHLGVDPLEFDGRSDSIFQQFDKAGGRFMEYLHDYGGFSDIPFDLMISEWQKHYPGFMRAGRWPSPGASAT